MTRGLGGGRHTPADPRSRPVGEEGESDRPAGERKRDSDFPGGTVNQESACQCRGRGCEPWSGKGPRATEPLRLCHNE